MIGQSLESEFWLWKVTHGSISSLIISKLPRLEKCLLLNLFLTVRATQSMQKRYLE